MSTPEHCLQNEILLAIGSRRDVRLFRQNVGLAWTGEVAKRGPNWITLINARPLHAGLAKGSADLIGLQRIRITPEMVGMDLAAFVSLEVKTPTGRATREQEAWLQMCRLFGARAGIVRSVEEAQAVLL